MDYLTRWEVVHGGRQLVPWGVLLSQRTSETCVFSCHRSYLRASTLKRLHSKGWGRCRLRYVCMPRMSWATRDIHWLEQRAATPKGEANPLKPIWFGSRTATRPREAEIPSNRMLSTYGEYVPGPCTHCLSSQPSRVMVRICFRADSNHSSVRRIKSTQGICRGTCRWITSFYEGAYGRPYRTLYS